VGRPRVDVVDRRLLDDLARVHHRDAVRDVGDHAHVVRDQDEAHVALLLELGEQAHDLRLHGHVERRGGLVGDQHLGVERQRHGDHDALAHAAGELVRDSRRSAAGRPGMLDLVERLDGAPLASLRDMPRCLRNSLGELETDRVDRVQGESASWKIIAMRLARTLRRSSSASRSRSTPR
jgi:hypothetical protein